jgi:magnesium transporter
MMQNTTLQLSEQLSQLIHDKNFKGVAEAIVDMEAVDIADVFQQLELAEQQFLYELMDNELSADMLLEVDEDLRKSFIKNLSSKDIAEQIINEIDSDDAADIIAELPQQQQSEIIQQIDDHEHAKSIVGLLRYDDDEAGGLMATEMVLVNHNLNIINAVKEMRRQAEKLDEVYSIYVVDDQQKLLGLLSLKKLLTSSSSTKVAEVYSSKVKSVKDHQSAEEVADFMQKYDLFEVPVINDLGTLVGRITIDDVIDFITEEAEKDYQMASGISTDVDSTDTIFSLTKARLPWLMIGMVGGLIGSKVLEGNQTALSKIPALAYFVPLIAATAGNVGVQASAIIVQGLANNSLGKSLSKTLSKELAVSFGSGIMLSAIIFMFNFFINHHDYSIAISVSLSLLVVITNAAIIGTLVPIILNKNKIDPAIATGPFITTSNDILGVLIYFGIAKMILHI